MIWRGLVSSLSRCRLALQAQRSGMIFLPSCSCRQPSAVCASLQATPTAGRACVSSAGRCCASCTEQFGVHWCTARPRIVLCVPWRPVQLSDPDPNAHLPAARHSTVYSGSSAGTLLLQSKGLLWSKTAVFKTLPAGGAALDHFERVLRGHAAAVGQRHAQRLDGRRHGVGGVHAAARPCSRAGIPHHVQPLLLVEQPRREGACRTNASRQHQHMSCGTIQSSSMKHEAHASCPRATGACCLTVSTAHYLQHAIGHLALQWKHLQCD
jgi:hypothetical protein